MLYIILSGIDRGTLAAQANAMLDIIHSAKFWTECCVILTKEHDTGLVLKIDPSTKSKSNQVQKEYKMKKIAK